MKYSLLTFGISLFILLSNKRGSGQDTSKEIVSLKIGEKVPDFYLSKIVNHPTLKSAKISDFRGKLLILDFWTTHCSVCVAEFPKIQNLQREFTEDVIILPVCLEERDNQVEIFVQKNKGSQYDLQLPTAVMSLKKDSLTIPWLKLFSPWMGVPHEVWIDKNGYLAANTDHRAVTRENIKAVLNDSSAGIVNLKYLNYIQPCKNTFLLKNWWKMKGKSSAFSEYIDTLQSSPRILDSDALKCDTAFWRFLNVNQPIINTYSSIYHSIYQDTFNIPYSKRIQVESSNPGGFYKSWAVARDFDDKQYKKFCEENLFCYEIALPKIFSRKQVYDTILADYDQFFKITREIRMVEYKCYAIIGRVDSSSYLSKANYLKSRKTKKLENVKKLSLMMNEFLEKLNNDVDGEIFINTSNYWGPIQIEELKNDFTITELREKIQHAGFDLIPYIKEIPTLILKN